MIRFWIVEKMDILYPQNGYFKIRYYVFVQTLARLDFSVITPPHQAAQISLIICFMAPDLVSVTPQRTVSYIVILYVITSHR